MTEREGEDTKGEERQKEKRVDLVGLLLAALREGSQQELDDDRKICQLAGTKGVQDFFLDVVVRACGGDDRKKKRRTDRVSSQGGVGRKASK